MKIALVSPYDYSYPGGVTNHILNLERQFLRLGHEVRVLAPCSSSASHISANVLPLGYLMPVLSGGSIARMALPFGITGKLRAILDREGFDVVHVHEPLFPSLPPVVLRWARCPKIATFHAYHKKPRGYWLTRPILRRWFRRLDGLIAVSPLARDFVARHFPGDYEIIPNGVDLEHFSPAALPLPELEDGKKNILFVGRLELRKGVGFLINAFAQVKRQFPDCRLIIVGPGRILRRRYERMARGLDDVVFTGPVSYDQLPRYYASAHVCCSPATGEESFGLVVLEAMAMGKPVVASDIPAYSSLVGQEAGLLVPPRDEGALAEAILSLLRHPDLGRQIGERGQRRAQQYSWEDIASRILTYYRRFC